MGWIATKTPGVQMRHANACKSHGGGKCRCARSWRARYKSEDGRWRWSPTYDSEQKAVEFKSGKRDQQTAEAQASKPGKPFNALFDEWIALAESGAVTKKGGKSRYSKGTLQTYRYVYENHVRAEIGKRDASKLTVQHWQLWLDGLVRAGKKRNSISVTLNVIRSVYRWACSPTRTILSVNATRGLELPAEDAEKRDRVATPEEAKALLAVLKDGDKVAYALGLYAGLRSVEREPLEWTDVDLKRNRLKIRISKSEAGKRTLPIIPPLRAILLAEHLRQGRPTDGLVVRGPKGGVPDRECLATRAREAWQAVGLAPIGMHECRHSFCTAMALSGIPIKALSTLAGHEDIKTTLDVYGHLYEGHEDEAGRLLASFFEPKPVAEDIESLSRDDLLALVRELRSVPSPSSVTNGVTNATRRTVETTS